MKRFWKAYHLKVNALTLRERKYIAVASVAVILSFFILTLWQPMWRELSRVNKQNEQFMLQIETSQNSISAIENRARKDVNAPYRAKLENMRVQVKEQLGQINNITAALIQPDKMNQVFKGLLKKNELKLESVKNEQAKIIKINDSDEENQALFQHGLKIEMRGKYLSGLKYLQSIEQQNWQLYWDELEFSMIKYPVGVLRMRVHTLSTSDQLLGL